MNKSILISIILIFPSSLTLLKGSEITMYVWAPHGLNIRSEPNTNSKILGVLSYRDSLSVVEKTTLTFTNLFINNSKDEKHPIYLKSNWVRIKSKDMTGYVIDAYLLDFQCPYVDEYLNNYLDRIAGRHKVQALDASYNLRFGTISFNKEQIILPNDKRISWSKNKIAQINDGIESEADYGVEDIKYFQGFTKQQLLIFLNCFYELESSTKTSSYETGMNVRRNWSDSIYLHGGIQEIELTFFPNKVIIFYYVSSC